MRLSINPFRNAEGGVPCIVLRRTATCSAMKFGFFDKMKQAAFAACFCFYSDQNLSIVPSINFPIVITSLRVIPFPFSKTSLLIRPCSVMQFFEVPLIP